MKAVIVDGPRWSEFANRILQPRRQDPRVYKALYHGDHACRRRLFVRVIARAHQRSGERPCLLYDNRIQSITGRFAMPVARRRSRVFTVSMPPEMAKAAKALAKRQNRTMSELMREAFRAYQKDEISRFFDEMGEYARTRNPHGYTEEDIPRLIKEVRAEMRAEREAAERKRA
jgi:predicted DNA-binding protein